MNNRGFTLIELLVSISIMSIVSIVFFVVIGNTFGLSNEKAYDIMKKGIISQVSEYIYECDNNLITCSNDYVWKNDGDNKTTFFYLDVMRKYEYFNEEDYINPITGEDVGKCMVINVNIDKNYTISVDLDDSECKK